MRPDYPIKTDRLLLRPFEVTDLADVHAYRRLPELARYLYDEALTEAETAEKLAKWSAMDELTEEGQSLALAATLDGTVIGEIDIKWLSRDNRQGELGYIFNPAFHGRGYAREAAEQMLDLAFGQLHLHRVIAQCDPRNEPSWRLMERLGMRREAHHRQNEIFKGEWGDLFVYAVLEEEWRGTA
ncbi:GNAT family N-acetyltransferase [Lentzea guizhouensis]|uniref:GNAT family N-acetyltransferase n=1 Tax=Lentzea guizhouensis TaxID=1586287 RepID=A0A1B2HY53_9PSEU|nr:GNAT family protein [Lentzea guizhouensis]ANZ42633.1 GNAT family N-acetyltransferase [Lentzea guizhouensis]